MSIKAHNGERDKWTYAGLGAVTSMGSKSKACDQGVWGEATYKLSIFVTNHMPFAHFYDS